jgi:LPS-assembly protein
MYAYDAEGSGLSRSEPGFATPYVGRVDANPTLAMPNYLRGWTLRPEIGIRETFYTAHLLQKPGTTVGTVANTPIDRNVLQASMEVRPPSLSKMLGYKPFGYLLKHTIEPRVIYRYQSGITNYGQVLRFDYRDILADDNEVEYGVINRLYGKKTTSSAECFEHPKYPTPAETAEPQKLKELIDTHKVCDDRQGPASELVTWELAQKYYMNTTWGGALVPGTRNVFDSTIDLTGIAFLTEPRHFSPIISRFKINYAGLGFQWALDYDPVLHQVNDSTVFVGETIRNWYFAVGHIYLNAPGEVPPNTIVQDVWNQFGIQARYGNVNKRGLSSGFGMAVDRQNSYIQSVSSQTTYNWDCCGITFEYQHINIPGVRNENFYKFALSLANFGTFGNLRRQDRIY